MRGAQGEALVAWLLQSLEDDGHVFNNIKPVNWLAATKALAKCLRGRLQAPLGRNVPYITPMLAAPLMFIDFKWEIPPRDVGLTFGVASPRGPSVPFARLGG